MRPFLKIFTLKVSKNVANEKKNTSSFLKDGEFIVQTINNLSIDFLLKVYLYALNLLIVQKNIRRKNIWKKKRN